MFRILRNRSTAITRIGCRNGGFDPLTRQAGLLLGCRALGIAGGAAAEVLLLLKALQDAAEMPGRQDNG